MVIVLKLEQTLVSLVVKSNDMSCYHSYLIIGLTFSMHVYYFTSNQFFVYCN